MERLERQVQGDAALSALIRDTRAEMELYPRHGESYGYVFYLLRGQGEALNGGCALAASAAAR